MKNKLLQSILAAALAAVIPFSTVSASPVEGLNMIECPAEGEIIYTGDNGEAKITFAGIVPPKQEEIIVGTTIGFDSNTGSYIIKSETPIENGVLIITEYEDESYTSQVSSESFSVTTVDGIAEVEVIDKYLYKNIKAALYETAEASEPLCEVYDFLAMTGLLLPEFEIIIAVPTDFNGMTTYTMVDWVESDVNEDNTFSYTFSLKPGEYHAEIRGERIPEDYVVDFTVSDAEFELGSVLIGTIPGLSGEDVQTYIDAGVLDGISYSSVDVLMNIDNDETGAILYVHLTEESRDSVLAAIDILSSNNGVKDAHPNYIEYPDDPVVTELTMTECPEEGEVIAVGEDGYAEITFSGIVPPIQKEVIVGTSIKHKFGTSCITVKSETPLENCTLSVVEYEDNTFTRPAAFNTYNVTTTDGIADIYINENAFRNVRVMLWNNMEEMTPLCKPIRISDSLINWSACGTTGPALEIDINAPRPGFSSYQTIKTRYPEINDDNTFTSSFSLPKGEYSAVISGSRVGTSRTIYFTVQ